MNKELVVQSDAIDFLIGEPDGKYDFIYIDPPYYCQRDFGQFNDNWENVGEANENNQHFLKTDGE